MTDKQIKVGVVGTSWWSDAMYLPALTKHPNAEVVAVSGRNLERAKSFAERWDIPQFFLDYERMYTDADLDAVIIATSNDVHHPMTMSALNHGLHVLCEKPLAMTYAEALEMTEKAESVGVKTMVPFTYAFMPTARYLKRLIADENYIGTPYHLNMRYYTGYARDSEYLWRFDLEKSGAGVVGDLGTHWLYIARWLYGEIVAVTTMLGHHVKRDARPDGDSYQQADDSAVMMLEFANGAQGVIHVTAVCYEDTPFGQTHHMEFHGSAGTLYSFTDWDTVQQVSGAKQGEGMVKNLPIPDDIWGVARRDTVHNTYKDIFREEDHMTRGFITAILNDTDSSPDFRDGLAIQRVLEAAILSGNEQRRVRIDEIT